jgi:hypothetical protein
VRSVPNDFNDKLQSYGLAANLPTLLTTTVTGGKAALSRCLSITDPRPAGGVGSVHLAIHKIFLAFADADAWPFCY